MSSVAARTARLNEAQVALYQAQEEHRQVQRQKAQVDKEVSLIKDLLFQEDNLAARVRQVFKGQ